MFYRDSQVLHSCFVKVFYMVILASTVCPDSNFSAVFCVCFNVQTSMPAVEAKC